MNSSVCISEGRTEGEATSFNSVEPITGLMILIKIKKIYLLIVINEKVVSLGKGRGLDS